MTLSRLRAGLRVGLDFFARRGVEASGRAGDRPAGLVDALSDLARPGVEAAEIPPAVAAFFVRTGDLDLLIRPRWRRGFRRLARLFRAAAARVGQLCMPVTPARIFTRIGALRDGVDGRPGARSCLRVYEDGGVMQVVAYATHRRDGVGYLSVAFPVPLGNLCGVLRLDLLEADAAGRRAVRLTSDPLPGRERETGVWLVVLGRWPLRLPLGETMWFWDASSPLVPADLVPELWPGTTLVGRHEQRLAGRAFAFHSYYFRPLRAADAGSAPAPGPAPAPGRP